jgi:trk system potassium uptake protein TrkH
MLRDFLSAEGLDRVISLLKAILITTLICELIGATALYGGFRPACSSATEALYASIFHSVSAFCNAGFSIFSNNLENFAASPLVNLPIIMLIVTGGIGFSVVYETVQWVRVRITRRAPYGHLSVHTRLVLRVTLVLILAGFVAVLLAGDWRGSSGAKIVLAGLFQSVTTRTAGLNTIPLRFLAPWCLVIFMLLMFIGGGSGGTAGGIKVSTVGLLYHSTKSLMKGRSRVEIMRRTISERAVNTAFVISGLAAAYVVCAVVALTWAHPQLPFFDLAFEVFSAFGTVGLSLGVTPQLSTWGKLIIIATMYLGRVGPLTVFIAMARRRDEALYEYPSATIVVG